MMVTSFFDVYYREDNIVYQVTNIVNKPCIDCSLIVKKGMAHFFPDDFASLLPELIDELVR